MGNIPSGYAEPLLPQPVPLCAVDQRYCMDEEVTLHLRQKRWSCSGEDSAIKDTRTGVVWFRGEGRAMSLRAKIDLLDHANNPVLNIKRRPFTFLDMIFDVFVGGHSEARMFKILASGRTIGNSKMTTTIRNILTGECSLIVVKGDFYTLNVMIYLGHPKQGGVPIARIHRFIDGNQLFFNASSYHLTVAANVDVAMCVALCMALDEYKDARGGQ